MNPEVSMDLDECVNEVLGLLTGLDLTYRSNFDKYRSVTRQINRALRANALEREWSHYASREDIGRAHEGVQTVHLRASVRPRIIGDDAVVLSRDDGMPMVWAFFLPRDAMEKYAARAGLWVSVTRQTLHFSRPFTAREEGLRIQVPVMREPQMFRLPPHPENDEDPLPEVPTEVREQLLDFDYPDLVLLRAAYYIAQSDPVMQPRVQTLEEQFKDLFYALSERDGRHTDSPFLNEFFLPIQTSINDTNQQTWHRPLADERH